MIGVVDVGGGLRDIYGAGVFDYCMDHAVNFDSCIGVSAGSANVASYLARQRGRNYKFYMDFAFRRQYMSMRNFLRSGSYVNLDYVYSALSNSGGESPLDYPTLARSRAKLLVVALNALTGGTIYFTKRDISQDNYHIFKASSCSPVVCKPYIVHGIPCFDGGLADPIPIQRAFDDGCDRVVVILTRPVDSLRTPEKDQRMARLLHRKYPKAAERLAGRWQLYNDQLALAKEYQQQGRALILAPDNLGGLETLTRDKAAMDRLYRKGYLDASAIRDFLARAK